MSAGGTSQNRDQPTEQPNDFYSDPNDNVWGGCLQPGDTHDEGMFPPDAEFDRFISDYHNQLTQVLNPETKGETHNLGYPESTIHSSLRPTPIRSSSLCEMPSEGGAVNWQSSGESERVDVRLSMQFDEPQLETPVPSTSNSAEGLGERKKPRKKEESGVCAQCGQTFTRKSDAKRHENTVHGGGTHPCEHCNTICSRRDALQRHIKDHH